MGFDFKSLKDKIANSLHLLQRPKQKREIHFGGCSELPFLRAFRERVCFSLRSREIGSLDFDGARRENVLCGAGYEWTQDLWSFLKLQEVGFSSYLGFYSHLSVLLMFRLNEAVRGRWIGPKT